MNQENHAESQGASPWQRWGEFLESHPRLWKATMVCAAVVGATQLGLDITDMAMEQHVSLFNAEMIPVGLGGVALGLAGARYVERNYISGTNPSE